MRLEFAPEALREMAEFAFKVNETTENIGARRLHTIMERVLEDVSFLAPDVARHASDEKPPMHFPQPSRTNRPRHCLTWSA